MAWRQLARRLTAMQNLKHLNAIQKPGDTLVLAEARNSFSTLSFAKAEATAQNFRQGVSGCTRIKASFSIADLAGGESRLARSWIGAMKSASRRHPFSTASSGGPGPVEAKAGEEEEVPEAEYAETPFAVERTKLLVLGGNGFVGSAVCKEAVGRGLPVLSINRSGAPRVAEPWVQDVDWVRGDVFETDKWRHLLNDVTAVISCIGAFGSNDFMRKINGDANIAAVNTASEEGVNRFVYVSAHDVGLPGFVLRGYYEGKRAAEEAVRDRFPYSGVILRPAMIHGTRQVGSISLPLSIVGAPLEMILKKAKWAGQLPLLGPALAPPVKVTAVAKTAVRSAIDNAIPPGVVDVWGILRFGDH